MCVVILYCSTIIPTFENNLIEIYNLSSIDFSSFVAVFYCFAAIFSLLSIQIMKYFTIYSTLMLFSVFIIAGQTLLAIAVSFPFESKLWWYTLMYISQILVGSAYGTQLTGIYTLIGIWFDGSIWLPFATSCLSFGFNFGFLLSRTIMPFIYNSNKDIGLTVSYTVFATIVGFVASLLLKRAYVVHINIAANENAVEDHLVIFQRDMNWNLSHVQYFSRQIWLMVIIGTIGDAFVTVADSQFVEPFMINFDVDERTANLIISIPVIMSVVGSFVFGWFAKYGYLIYFLIIGMSLWLISIIIVYASHEEFMAWIAMFLNQIGLSFFCSFLYCFSVR